MLEMQFFKGQQKLYEPGSSLFCTARTWVWRPSPVEDQTSPFLSAEQKKSSCFSLHFTKNTVLFLVKVSAAGLKGLMWFMTVVPDMYHHHPTLGSRMAGNFFSSFLSKRDSPELCDTSTQFTFVSFIKRCAPPTSHLIFIHPLNRSVLEDTALAFRLWCPRKLWQNMSPVRESAETKLFSEEAARQWPRLHVPTLKRRGFVRSDLFSVLLQPGRGRRSSHSDAGFQPDNEADVTGGSESENGEPNCWLTSGELAHLHMSERSKAALVTVFADLSRKWIDGNKRWNTL